LGVGVFYSFLGTVICIPALVFIAPTLGKFAIRFGPYEYFAVTAVSLFLVAGLADKTLLKGLISAILGMLFSMVGIAPVVGSARFTFGFPSLLAGFTIIPLLVGLYAFPELLRFAQTEIIVERRSAPKIRGLGFSFAEFKSQIANFIRSALIGLGIGILPGIGGATANVLAYAVAKNSSKYPEKFGTGIIDGVVASESSNNASISGAMIPLLSLGIPGDGTTALLLGGLTLQGITAGPLFFTKNIDLAYLIYAAMIVASFMMLIMEFVGMKIFVKLLSIPLYVLLPIIMVICAFGSFTATNTFFSVWVFFGFGAVGYLLGVLEVPIPPLVLGYVLGSTNELYLFRGLQMTRGSFLPFLKSPICIVILLIGIIYLLCKIFRIYRSYSQI
jgi:putative tricarboxylic transport membrane protein